MRVVIIAAIGLLACGCRSDEGPTGPTRSTAEHLVIVRVLDAQSGTSLTNLFVTVLDGPLAGTTSTSPSDQVPLQLPSGGITLRIEARGFHPVDRAVRVDAPMVVEIRADRIVFSLSGAVRDAATGAGITNAEIEIVLGADSGRTLRSQSDGSYRFEQLTPGGIRRLRIKAEGYIERLVEISLTESQTIDLVLSELFRFTGLVTDGRGAPLAGVRVRTNSATRIRDSSGRFELRASENTVLVTRLEPPDGYEPTFGATIQAGRNNVLAVKRILRLTLGVSSQMCLGEGRRNVRPSVAYDTGDVVQLAGTRNYDVHPFSSNPQVLAASIGGSADGAYLEPLAPGTSTVTATYWGVASPAINVRVVRC